MELVALNKNIPVKSIPEKELNRIIIEEFTVWISGLLSLTDETSMDRLEMALPAIKEHCWSMGFSEIKKMFEMYADNKLSIKPLPNYFDRILFGKIVHAYKQQKPVKKTVKMPEISQDKKELLIYEGCINCFEEWKQTGQIIDGYVWVHDHLMDLKLIDFSLKEKEQMWIKAKENIEKQSKLMSYEKAKDFLRQLEVKNNGIREVEYKKIRLKRFFDRINAKGKHIKSHLTN